MLGSYNEEGATSRSISLADLSTLLGGHITVCSSPELSIDEKTNFMKAIEQLPRHMKSTPRHRVTSLVDFAGSTSGQLCNNKMYGVDEFNKAMTHANDFDRDLSATKEYKEYQDLFQEDFEAKAKATGKNFEELAKKGFAIKNSQWNSYWRGKVAGGLCMAMTMTEGKSISDIELKQLGIGRLQKNSYDLRAVIAVMIDGGPVTQQEQREMPQICDDVVFDLRRQGYNWASNVHVLLVRFPDVQTMLRSLDGERNLLRSKRIKMKQKDAFKFDGEVSLCWEFNGSTAFFKRSAEVSFFAKEWEEALKYDEHILYQAAVSGDAEGVKRVLQSKVRLADFSENGETVLHALAARGDSTSVRLLLGELKDDKERKAYPKQFKDDDERQEYMNKGHKDGRSPLFIAALRGHVEVVEILLKCRADLNKLDEHGRSPLSIASRWGHVEVVEILLKCRADLNKLDEHGASPLLAAAENGRVGVIEILAKNGADLNTRKIDGASPLLMAASKGHVGVVEILAKKRADLNTPTNNGASPLAMAALTGHVGVVEFLVKNGPYLNTQMNDGRSPLSIASRWGHVKIVEILLEFGAHADLNKLDKDGVSPIAFAAYKGHEAVVKVLVAYNADIKKSDNEGDSPLHKAAGEGHSACVEILVQSCVDINAPNKDGRTPLHLASRDGHERVVTLLLQNKAKEDKKDKDGHTPRDMARVTKRQNIVRVLTDLQGSTRFAHSCAALDI